MKRTEHTRRRIVAIVISTLFVGLAGDATGLKLLTHGHAAHASARRQKGRQATRRARLMGARAVGQNVARGAATPLPAGGAAASPTPTPASSPAVTPTPGDTAGLKIKLYYLREAAQIAAILKEVAKQQGSDIKDLVIASSGTDEIVLYGPKQQRDYARRVVATLDLPRPGIQMEMWGVQISSPKPEKLAAVLTHVREVIDQTQQDVRDTYEEMQQAAREAIPDADLDKNFEHVLEQELFYASALDANRQLSLTDILMRMIAAKDPSQAARRMAERLTEIGARRNAWRRDPRYVKVAELVPERPPFERFLRARGLRLSGGRWADAGGVVNANAAQGQRALLEFALHYGRLIHEPRQFSPYHLQQAAETLNARLQAAIDALNLDMQDLFVTPTLAKIQKIVRDFKDVEYAQVGKTSVSSLSGIVTEVTSSSVSAFDVTPPLRLSELLTKAKTLSDSAGPFVPNPADNLVGAMPLAQVIGLIGALGEERSVWRELKAGVSLTITPNVLRNMTSAELQVVLKTGDPQGATREANVRPLSRVSQHDVKTNVYINALDFFDLSGFTSQSTLDGGRGYVPIVGPIWRGLFSDLPVVGNLLSWKKDAKNVYHQSLVLTTSFITPTAMGVAVLYPTERYDREAKEVREYDFVSQFRKVEEYFATRLSRK